MEHFTHGLPLFEGEAAEADAEPVTRAKRPRSSPRSKN
jgi:hypothetical protein